MNSIRKTSEPISLVYKDSIENGLKTTTTAASDDTMDKKLVDWSQTSTWQKEKNHHLKTTSSLRVPKRYIDELGFYRANKQLDDYDQFYRSVRRDLRISHFDRTQDHEGWKNNWDVFIKNKLVRKEPVKLNSEFKIRCRSGIPQDYRRKVWTALINMRVKHIKQQRGHDLYAQLISSPETTTIKSDPLSTNNPNSLDNNNCDINKQQQKQTETTTNNNTDSNQEQQPTTNGNSVTKVLANGTTIPFDETNMTATKVALSKLDKCSKQIELDLLRTLPNNKHFDHPDSMGIQRVRRVLRAYAKYNPIVGYCQGMNRLAAVALLILPEEDAFWCLVAIIECIMPKDYYVKPWLAQVDCCVLNDLLANKMPVLHKHLVKHDVDLALFTWFFTVFVDGFRPELTLRIWDCYLLEGDKVLFRFALALVHIAQDELLQMTDFATMNNYLQKLGSNNKLDIEHIFQSKYTNVHIL